MSEFEFQPASPFHDLFGDPATRRSRTESVEPAPQTGEEGPATDSRLVDHPGLDPTVRELLLDPEGATDRMVARSELAGRFDIVDDGYEGDRMPNTVTASEYEEIVRTYSDIRLGRSDIVVDRGLTDANYAYDMTEEEYRDAAMDDIADIMQTESGRDLVGALHDNRQTDEDGNEVHRKTHIQAHTDDMGQWADDSRAATGEFDNGDAIIMINPNRDIDNTTEGGNQRTRSDVGLYHEMVHAYHDTRGTAAEGFVEAGDLPGNYAVETDAAHNRGQTDDAEKVERAEHQAAGLGAYQDAYFSENNYRSERFGVGASGRGIGGDFSLLERLAYSDDYDDYDKFDGAQIEP